MNRHIMSVHDVPLRVPSRDMDVSLELSKDTIHITVLDRSQVDSNTDDDQE